LVNTKFVKRTTPTESVGRLVVVLAEKAFVLTATVTGVLVTGLFQISRTMTPGVPLVPPTLAPATAWIGSDTLLKL
jgi:hypothetical protein